MTKEIDYEEFTRDYVKRLCDKYGTRAVSRYYGLDASLISKMANGKLYPSPKKFTEYFGIELEVRKVVVLKES